MDTCPSCHENALERVAALVVACHFCGYIAEGLAEDRVQNLDPLVKKLVLALFDSQRHRQMFIDQAKSNGINISFARQISPESWLNKEEFSWFKAGHAYASGQTHAISGLAACSPEEAFYIVVSVVHGAKLAGKPISEDA